MYKTILIILVFFCLESHPCQGSSAFLLYTEDSWFWGHIYKSNINNHGLLAGQKTQITTSHYIVSGAVTYDPIDKYMYWVDVHSYYIHQIHRIFLNGSQEETVVKNLRTVVDLAIDEAGRNLYWADRDRGRIEAAKLDGTSRKLLIRVQSPNAMVLDSKAREIYWTSYSNGRMKIEKASMDGSNRTVVISKLYRKRPTGLTIDIEQRMLYWVEKQRQYIYYIKLTMPSTIHSIQVTGYKPFRVAIIGQRIYWIERGSSFWATGEIGTLNTTTASDIKILMNQVASPKDIHAYDPNRPQYRNTKCGVNNGGCQHLCLQSPQGDKCVCADGMVLQDDGKTCDYNDFILAADHGSPKIYHKSLDDLSHRRTALPLGRTGYVNTVDFDPIDRKVYWTNNKGIIYRAFLNGSSIQKVIDSHYWEPSGHAIDVIGRNLYWCDRRHREIGVSKLDGRYKKVLVNLTRKPYALTLDSNQGYFYWIYYSNYYLTIKRSLMNGTNQSDVINNWRSSKKIAEVSLAFDSGTNKLYFHDGHKIYHTNTNPTNGVVYALSLPSSIVPTGLAVKDSYIYWSDWYDEIIYRVNKTTLKNIETIASDVDPIDLHVYHNYTDTPDDFHPCAQFNGWCTHLCLIHPGGYSCVCPSNTGSIICNTTPVIPQVSTTPLPSPSSTNTAQPFSTSIIVSSSAQVILSSAQVLKSSAQFVLSSAQVVTSSTKVVLSSAQVVTSSAQVVLSSAQIVQSSAKVVLSSAQVVTSSAQVVQSSAQVVQSSAHVIPSSDQVVQSSAHVVQSSDQVVPSSAQVALSSSINPSSSSSSLHSTNIEKSLITSSTIVLPSPSSSSYSTATKSSSSTSSQLSSSSSSTHPLTPSPSSSSTSSPSSSSSSSSLSLSSSLLSSLSSLSSSSSASTTTAPSKSSSSIQHGQTSSVLSSVHPTPALTTTKTTPSSATITPTCPPMYYPYDCTIYIGENKMTLTVNTNDVKLSEKLFKDSVSKGITEYCKNQTCADLLRSSKKTRRDVENQVKFSAFHVLILTNPAVFSTLTDVLRIELAILNPLGQESSVLSRPNLCKLISNAKEFIESFLRGPKISKLNPECQSGGGSPPSAGKQKNGGTSASVTISLSVLFVILLLLVIIFFTVRYIRKKAVFGRRQARPPRNEFSFQNAGYLTDDSFYDCSEPNFTTTTTAHARNRNQSQRDIKNPSTSRPNPRTPSNGIYSDLSNRFNPSNQIDQHEEHEYERLKVAAQHLPAQEAHGNARPFGYARLNHDTMLNHDYEAINPMNRRKDGFKENDYNEIENFGNPLYSSATSSGSRDHTYDNNEITNNDPFHVEIRSKKSRDRGHSSTDFNDIENPTYGSSAPRRTRDHPYDNNEITRDDPIRRDKRSKGSRDQDYENNEILRIDPQHENSRPHRSKKPKGSKGSKDLNDTTDPEHAYDHLQRFNQHHRKDTDSTEYDHLKGDHMRSKGSKERNDTTDSEHAYDHLQRFNQQPRKDTDSVDYDHLRRDRRGSKGSNDHRQRSDHVLHIDGPDDKEETII